MMPDWGLSLAYALHFLATVIWIGGLTSLAFLVIPSARKSLVPGTFAVLLGNIEHRLQSIGWFCLAVLAVTGLFQMSANPHYQGFLAITNLWATAILLKHLAIAGMVLVSIYTTWWLYPAMQRSALRQSVGAAGGAETGRYQRQQRWLLSLNIGLAVIILGLTAVARAA